MRHPIVKIVLPHIKIFTVRLLCGLFCVIAFSACKTLNGDYYESFGEGWGAAEYHFGNDHSFTYSAQFDVGALKGKGTYRIMFGRIKFTFDSMPPPPPVPVNMQVVKRDTGDKSRFLRVTVLDETLLGMPGAIVTTGEGMPYGAMTNLDGKASLLLFEPVDTVRLIIRFTGYARVDTAISVKSLSHVTVTMVPSEDSYSGSAIDSGTVWKYGIRKNREGVITLKKTDYSIEYNEDHRRYLHKKRRRLKLMPR